MGGEIAVAPAPLCGRVRRDGAEGACFGGHSLCTAFTFVDDLMALAAVEIAPFSGHEGALSALLYGYALHGIILRRFLRAGKTPR